MDQKLELKDRFVAKQKQLEAQIVQLRADARGAAREEIKKIEAILNEGQQAVKGSWEKLTDEASQKINEWLKD